MLTPKRIKFRLKPPAQWTRYCLVAHALVGLLMVILPLSFAYLAVFGGLVVLSYARTRRQMQSVNHGYLLYQGQQWYLLQSGQLHSVAQPQCLVLTSTWLVLAVAVPNRRRPCRLYMSPQHVGEAEYRWLCRFYNLLAD